MIIYYVAHPYAGKPENKAKVEAIIRRLQAQSEHRNVYLSPIHALGWYYSEVDYHKGVDHCLELLSRCSCLILCGEWQTSAGCRAEKLYAEGAGIPIWYPSEGSID
jgi:hypothetical protein